MGIIETAVASYLSTDEMGLFERFVFRLKFYFCHNQSLIVAIKLVNLKHMVARTHEVACLVDDARFT